MAINIGELQIRNNLIMAPMAGVTDVFFRALVWEHGAGLTVSEMVSAKSIVYNNQKTLRLLHNVPHIRPWAIQFFGSEPAIIAEAIKRLDFVDYDIVDINMGCPMPKIVKNGEGAALMMRPLLAGQIIAAAAKASHRPVTVKIRKGFTAATANAVEMAKIAQESGAAAIAVHGRTRDQFYTGQADWEAIGAVKAAVGIPVIGNGDIDTPQMAKKRLDESGCDGIMLARGAMGNPWLFSHTLKLLETGKVPPPPSNAQIIDAAIKHVQMVATDETAPIREMRKHLCWYTKGMHGSADARRRINMAQTSQDMVKILLEMRE